VQVVHFISHCSPRAAILLRQFSDLFPWLSPFGLTSTPKPLWIRDPLDDYAAYGLQV